MSTYRLTDLSLGSSTGRQALLDLSGEIVVDLFAGGGGASTGIERALGFSPHVAVNHDRVAVAMHAINHPQTEHHTCDVFEVNPRLVTKGRPVGALWASPDCTFHSKARGGKPIRSGVKKRRALAWVVTRWAAQVRPRVIVVENVEEFQHWGPLVGPREALRPCKKRRGQTFRQWVKSLTRLGYEVQWKELRACDFGAPTIRRRLFLIARCDGRAIVWPVPTHGPSKALRPYRTAAECIDWSIPCPSIFERARPLAEATLRRIARGLVRYVVENPEPFIVANDTGNVPRPASAPVTTVTTGDRLYLTVPALAQIGYGERAEQAPRALDVAAPLGPIVGTQKHALVASFLAQHNAGPNNQAISGRPADAPISTITTTGGQQQLVAASLATIAHGEGGGTAKRWGNGAHDVRAPVCTVTTSGNQALVAAFLATYYGTSTGQYAGEALHTVTTRDRHAVVTVEVRGATYAIVDVGMRMLQPRELYRAQGFPDAYVIDAGPGGRRLTKTEQVRMVGNSVCPQVAAALVAANVPDLATHVKPRAGGRAAARAAGVPSALSATSHPALP